jgi:hypothetical protein
MMMSVELRTRRFLFPSRLRNDGVCLRWQGAAERDYISFALLYLAQDFS